MSNILVDTNILVYALDEDSRFYSQSRQLLLHANSNLFTTSKNLSEFLAVVTRCTATPLSIEEALEAIGDFVNILTVLYPTERSFAVFEGLLRKYKPAGLKIHDFEIMSIGLCNEVNRVATLNCKDFEGVEEIKIVGDLE